MPPSTWTTSTCHQNYTFLPTPTPTLRISFPGHNILIYVQKRWLVGWNIMDYHLNLLPRLWMEASFGCHWQFTQIFFSCSSTPFTLAPQGLCDSSWWSWTISFDLILSSAIFSRCPQYLEGSGTFWTTTHFSTRSATSYSTGFSHLVRTYSWGFRQKATLPYGFVLLKRKKDWQEGRTLISYFQSYQSTLLKAVSRCLDPMLREVWPQQLGQQSVPQIWNTIRSAFREIPEEAHLQFLNDDLVGFFNSVPQDRLLMQFRHWW